jgi:ABC-2 type transport system permease protein
MRREGPAFQGAGTVFVKELADHISSIRMLMLELLVVLTASAALYEAIDNLRKNTSEDLRLRCLLSSPFSAFSSR